MDIESGSAHFLLNPWRMANLSQTLELICFSVELVTRKIEQILNVDNLYRSKSTLTVGTGNAQGMEIKTRTSGSAWTGCTG